MATRTTITPTDTVPAPELRLLFDETLIRKLAAMVAAVHPPFAAPAFIRECLAGLDPLSLSERAKHLMRTLAAHLPSDFKQAAAILLASLGPKGDDAHLDGVSAFLYLPHVSFVAAYGLDHFETAMHLQYELTQRFTAEFSIRAFLERHPEAALARLRLWAEDPSEHVRRLVSEGTRPRLPWAQRLRQFQKDPRPVLALLERLKDDPSLYVRRSVANNLNDIGKDHPALLVATCRRWAIDASPERSWIIRHALRSAVKQGDKDALDILGYGTTPAVTVERAWCTPATVAIGGNVAVRFRLVSQATTTQALAVDLAVHFVKANGRTNPKVFKVATCTLAPGATVEVGKTISVAQLTTRKHYPGLHRVDVLINGVVMPAGQFQLTD